MLRVLYTRNSSEWPNRKRYLSICEGVTINDFIPELFDESNRA